MTLKRLRALSTGKGLRAQLLRGGVGSLFIKVIHALLTFLIAVLLARILDPAGYGAYSFVLALLTVLAIPAQFGLPNLVIRETAKAQSEEAWGLMKGVWRWANTIALSLSLSIGLIAIVAVLKIGHHFDPVVVSTFGVGLLLVPLTAIGNLRGAALCGLRNVVQGQLPELALRPAFLALAILSFLLLAPSAQFTPYLAMAMTACAALFAFIIGTWLLLKNSPPELRQTDIKPVYLHRNWIASVLPMALIAGMHLINKHTDVLMLGWFLTPEDVGRYAVAAQGAMLVVFGLNAANMVVSPHFARLYVQGDLVRLQRLVTVSARAIFAVALPTVLLLVFAGEQLLRIVFGEAYTHASSALAILALGQLVNATMGSVGFLLTMTGHEREVARGVAIAAACNVGLNLFLIPPYGLEGAAIATAVSTALWNVILWRSVSRHLGIRSTAFSLYKQ